MVGIAHAEHGDRHGACARLARTADGTHWDTGRGGGAARSAAPVPYIDSIAPPGWGAAGSCAWGWCEEWWGRCRGWWIDASAKFVRVAAGVSLVLSESMLRAHHGTHNFLTDLY